MNQFAHDLVVFKRTGQLGGAVDPGEISAADMIAALQGSPSPVTGLDGIPDAADCIEFQSTVEEKVRDGIGALFSLSLVATWTAVETLAGDLWEAALNARPALASKLGKPIPINWLEKHRFSVEDRMGTILREMRTATFATLEDIRKAYDAAFAEHGDAIHGAVHSDSLDQLALARNMIVHRGGKCDEEYKRRAAQFPQRLPQLQVGELLQLDGELVKNLIQPTVDSCRLLILSMGTWLDNHPA